VKEVKEVKEKRRGNPRPRHTLRAWGNRGDRGNGNWECIKGRVEWTKAR
jgi:hypothetical protein